MDSLLRIESTLLATAKNKPATNMRTTLEMVKVLMCVFKKILI